MIVNRTIPFLLLVALGCVIIISPVLAQTENSPFDLLFTARQDDNLDGAVDDSDAYQLSGAGPTGTVGLSLSDVSVTQIALSRTGQAIAYLGTRADASVLDIIPTPDTLPIRTELADIVPQRVIVFDDYTWLIGEDTQGIPLLRGYLTATASVVGEYRFRRPNTPVSIDPSGRFALAYNLESGGITVLSLPLLTLADFALEGYMIEPPRWSPTRAQMVIGVVATPEAASLDLTLVDFEANETRTLISLPREAAFTLEWSENGQLIVLNEATSVTLVNVASAVVTRFDGEGRTVGAAAWSSDDARTIVALQDPAGPITWQMLDTASGAVAALPGLTALNVSSVHWNSQQDWLVVAGQGVESGSFGLWLYDPAADSLTLLFENAEASIAAATVTWSADGSRILFTAASGDAVFTTTGTPLALYQIDLGASGALTRLSAENLSVESISLYR